MWRINPQPKVSLGLGFVSSAADYGISETTSTGLSGQFTEDYRLLKSYVLDEAEWTP